MSVTRASDAMSRALPELLLTRSRGDQSACAGSAGRIPIGRADGSPRELRVTSQHERRPEIVRDAPSSNESICNGATSKWLDVLDIRDYILKHIAPPRQDSMARPTKHDEQGILDAAAVLVAA